MVCTHFVSVVIYQVERGKRSSQGIGLIFWVVKFEFFETPRKLLNAYAYPLLCAVTVSGLTEILVIRTSFELSQKAPHSAVRTAASTFPVSL